MKTISPRFRVGSSRFESASIYGRLATIYGLVISAVVNACDFLCRCLFGLTGACVLNPSQIGLEALTSLCSRLLPWGILSLPVMMQTIVASAEGPSVKKSSMPEAIAAAKACLKTVRPPRLQSLFSMRLCAFFPYILCGQSVCFSLALVKVVGTKVETWSNVSTDNTSTLLRQCTISDQSIAVGSCCFWPQSDETRRDQEGAGLHEAARNRPPEAFTRC